MSDWWGKNASRTKSITAKDAAGLVAARVDAAGMGNISWRSQVSSEDTDSSLQGDLDEDSGKDACGCYPEAATRGYFLIRADTRPFKALNKQDC